MVTNLNLYWSYLILFFGLYYIFPTLILHLYILLLSFRHPNVVILTTSNVTEKIDLAFVDRADIKQYIGPPSEQGIYNIYLSCLEELMKVRLNMRWFGPAWCTRGLSLDVSHH